MVHPDSFYEVYADHGTGGKQDQSLWQPSTRVDGYVCLGTVASLNYNAPTELMSSYVCLKRDLVEQGDFGYEIWNDKGSKGKEDISLWSVESILIRVLTIYLNKKAPQQQPEEKLQCCYMPRCSYDF